MRKLSQSLSKTNDKGMSKEEAELSYQKNEYKKYLVDIGFQYLH